MYDHCADDIQKGVHMLVRVLYSEIAELIGLNHTQEFGFELKIPSCDGRNNNSRDRTGTSRHHVLSKSLWPRWPFNCIGCSATLLMTILLFYLDYHVC